MLAVRCVQRLSKEDATTIITTMAKYENFFIDHMMVQELGMMSIDEDDSPAKQVRRCFVVESTGGVLATESDVSNRCGS